MVLPWSRWGPSSSRSGEHDGNMELWGRKKWGLWFPSIGLFVLSWSEGWWERAMLQGIHQLLPTQSQPAVFPQIRPVPFTQIQAKTTQKFKKMSHTSLPTLPWPGGLMGLCPSLWSHPRIGVGKGCTTSTELPRFSTVGAWSCWEQGNMFPHNFELLWLCGGSGVAGR